MSTRRLALIPARGGSKRLVGKNIRDFFGHPMLAYSVAAARTSGLFTEVVVSTDDDATAAVALAHGATVHERPAELADDHSNVSDVAVHAVQSLGGFDEVCLLMPNCPLRRSADILEQHAAFSANGRAQQVSVVHYRCVYPNWSIERDAEGRGTWYFGERLVRSQDLEPLVAPTGAVWWSRVDALVGAGTFYGPGFHVELMDATRGVDIDTLEDLEYAETLVLGLQARHGSNPLEPVESPR
jgi:CMP-N-acetylneuraminic acid synthetase